MGWPRRVFERQEVVRLVIKRACPGPKSPRRSVPASERWSRPTATSKAPPSFSKSLRAKAPDYGAINRLLRAPPVLSKSGRFSEVCDQEHQTVSGPPGAHPQPSALWTKSRFGRHSRERSRRNAVEVALRIRLP
jgi:hypothetical protein